MKLRNKLIPLMSLTATAVTVAPLATSCGNVVLDQKTELTDVLHGYLPDIDRAEATTKLSPEQAKDLYMEHVEKNPDIFAQDLYWWESLAIKSRLYYACFGDGTISSTDESTRTNTSFMHDLYNLYGLSPAAGQDYYWKSFSIIPQVAKFGVSDIKFNKVKLVNPYSLTEETIHTISLKMNYEYEYELDGDCVKDTSRYMANRATKISLTSEYKNIPFTVVFDSEYATWRVMPLGWWKVPGFDSTWILTKHHDWSFNFDYKCITTDTVRNYCGGTDTYTYDESQGGLIDSVAKMVNWIPQNPKDQTYAERVVRYITFNFGSYFLYDILGQRWTTGNLGYVDNVYYNPNDETTKIHMNNVMNFNWSYEEQSQTLHPQYSNRWHLLNDETTAEGVEKLVFDLYKKDSTTQVKTKIGTVTFKKEDNTGIGYIDSATSAQISLIATMNVDDEENLPEDKDDLIQNYSFTIPQGTKFKFNIYYGWQRTSSGYEEVYNEEDVTIQNDVNCFWYATNYNPY